MSDDAIRRLEEKIAYLEHHVTEQDRAMLEFAEDLARLKRELKAVTGRLASSGGQSAGDDLPVDERPPHY
jgi:SlyX protein